MIYRLWIYSPVLVDKNLYVNLDRKLKEYQGIKKKKEKGIRKGGLNEEKAEEEKEEGMTNWKGWRRNFERSRKRQN